MSISRVIVAVGVLLAGAAPAFSQDDGNWIPDAKAVDQIEKTLRSIPLPKLGNWEATPLDSYARYYTGATADGRKVIYGVFLALDPARYPPGIHIVPVDQQPHMTGGLCGQLNLWYDVAEARVKQFHCYGLG